MCVPLSVPRPRAWKKLCRRPAADECGADACKSHFHGFFSCLWLYKPAHACRCSPQLLNPFTSPVELIRGRRISAASFYRSPGSRTRAFRFVFFWRQVHAPCGIWTRAFFVLPLPGDGTAGWAMRERMAFSIFFTCRHIRAFTSVIMCTVQQKFSEKKKFSCLDSNPIHQIHGPTPWPLHHDILQV